MPVQTLDVVWIFDDNIRPPKPKMVVCICKEDNLFYRINTYDDFPIGVLLPLEPNHKAFLKHDSYLECGKHPLEIDDFTIEKALAENNGNPIGRVHEIHSQAIYDAVNLQAAVSREVKNLIRIALGC